MSRNQSRGCTTENPGWAVRNILFVDATRLILAAGRPVPGDRPCKSTYGPEYLHIRLVQVPEFYWD